MIDLFDCNVRIGMRALHTPGEPTTTDELLAEMDRLSISRALVRHQLALETGPAAANRRLLDELAGSERSFDRAQDRLLATCSLLPKGTLETGRPTETLPAMIASGVRAVWLYPKAHGWVLAEWCAGSLLGALEKRRVPVFLPWDQVDLQALAAVLDAHPALPVVLANVSYRQNRVLYPLFELHANLRLDLGAPNSGPGFIEEVTARFGAHRLLFGSGYPDHEIGPAVTYLMYADVDDAVKAQIGSGNLEALLAGVRP